MKRLHAALHQNTAGQADPHEQMVAGYFSAVLGGHQRARLAFHVHFSQRPSNRAADGSSIGLSASISASISGVCSSQVAGSSSSAIRPAMASAMASLGSGGHVRLSHSA